ncbi:hypothetical protein [Dictyobacter arantiisoli]|uniref:DinB-like domain-containing protein n=1 Tax=Dictyobacter arantiisoli TaxID=2014874 RepID=A0A5A5TBA7_9CHLR|nr:hypothetical protein [Dictyobacter arantiisoli]GCF08761.1 hypothetical protein KDI_23250 [Dictyobacter arantiisoli]
MNNAHQAAQFAVTLEKIGNQALLECRALPDDLLNWSPAFSTSCTPMLLALELAQVIENWVLVPVGGRQPALMDHVTGCHSPATFPILSACYAEWIKSVHTILDSFPNALLDLLVEKQSLAQKLPSQARPTVHTCLLTAVERSALHLGEIQILCHTVMWNTMPAGKSAQSYLRGIV